MQIPMIRLLSILHKPFTNKKRGCLTQLVRQPHSFLYSMRYLLLGYAHWKYRNPVSLPQFSSELILEGFLQAHHDIVYLLVFERVVGVLKDER